MEVSDATSFRVLLAYNIHCGLVLVYEYVIQCFMPVVPLRRFKCLINSGREFMYLGDGKLEEDTNLIVPLPVAIEAQTFRGGQG